MSAENALWGAPRIHGELLKLGFAVAQSTVAKYMTGRGGPCSQGWDGDRAPTREDAMAAFARSCGCERARTTRRRSAQGAVMTDLEHFGTIVLIAFGVAIVVFVVLGAAQWLLS